MSSYFKIFPYNAAGFKIAPYGSYEEDGVAVPNDALTSTDITAGSPSIDTTTLSEIVNRSLTANQITTGAPSIDTPTLSEQSSSHSLTSTDITAGSPSIDSPTLSEQDTNNELTSTDITSGAPSIDTPTVSEEGTDQLTSTDITTSAPSIDDAVITQNHDFSKIGPARPKTFIVTVQEYFGSDKFYIDNVRQPTLDLYTGSTYIFDQSDSSNAGHPLVFEEYQFGGGGASYTTNVTTTGTPGTAGAKTTITVASDAPRLSYVCSVHGVGMGSIANTPEDFGPLDIVADEPSIDTTTASEQLGADSITTGVPTIDDSDISQVHDLTAESIDTGSVVIDDADAVISADLVSNDITTGAPSVDQSTLTENNAVIGLNIITGVPVVDESRILGVAALSRVDIDGANDILLSDSRSDVMITSESRTSVLIEESQILAEVA